MHNNTDKKRTILLLAIIAAVLITGGIGYALLSGRTGSANIVGKPSSTPGQTQKETAPDFIVYNEKGDEVTLSSFMGTPVVLNFWASWCGPCRSEMPDFQKAFAAQNGEIAFMMVNLTDGSRETKAAALKYIEQNKFTFPVYFDLDMDAAQAYGVTAIPTTYFIDKDGIVVAVARGPLDEATLQKGIGMILK